MLKKAKFPSLNESFSIYKQEGQVGTYQIILPFLTTARPMLKYLPHSWGESFSFFKNNYIIMYLYEKNLRQTAQDVLAVSDSDIPNEWVESLQKIVENMDKECRNLMSVDLSKINSEDLRTMYFRLFDLDQEMWSLLIFIDSFDTGVDREFIETVKNKHNFSDDEVNTLLAPLEPSYTFNWQKALLDYNHGIISKEQLISSFYWYAIDYSNFREVDDRFISEEISKNHYQDFESPKSKQDIILAKHNLKLNPLVFFQNLAIWRDRRKKYNYMGLFGLGKILQEIMSRKKLDIDFLNGLLPQQVEDLFDGKITSSQLSQQLSGGVYQHVDSNGDFFYSFGDEAKSYWDEVLRITESNLHNVKELKGMVASKGRVSGRVLVVDNPNEDNYKKMNDGDILVTSMTRPEFLPFMKKSGAIVTNEGGISSHAAIVAREMNKPCIIGTKIATKVLKDGDLVEVDADRGVVTIIERRN